MGSVTRRLYRVGLMMAIIGAAVWGQWAPSAEAARGGGKTEVLPMQKAAPSVVTVDRQASEQELRKALREKNGVSELSGNGSFSRAPIERFGFISARMLGMALVTQSPDLGLERVAQNSGMFEVHKLADGSGMVVGFVGRDNLAELTAAQRPKTLRLALHSSPTEKAPVIVAVPIVKLVADRMPFRFDPQKPDGPMVFDMDLQGSANRQKAQGGP
ncbi:MAG: hypothetical protein KF814_05430 [Nitrospiraceae bacterium]|nr:hypothetical protein [Nitrospiraceae bacterium]